VFGFLLDAISKGNYDPRVLVNGDLQRLFEKGVSCVFVILSDTVYYIIALDDADGKNKVYYGMSLFFSLVLAFCETEEDPGPREFIRSSKQAHTTSSVINIVFVCLIYISIFFPLPHDTHRI
jgi:hypothetical protein